MPSRLIPRAHRAVFPGLAGHGRFAVRPRTVPSTLATMNHRLAIWAALAAGLALSSPASAQTQWTVDDTGPADFTSLADAVANVASGDILLIQPGTYGDVTIDKRLSLLGDPSQPRPKLGALVIDGASRFTLAHLETDTLSISNVAARSEIDGCLIEGFQYPGMCELVDVAELHIQGTTFRGTVAVPDGTIALLAEGNTRVVVTDCSLRGGDAWADDFSGLAGWAGQGVVARSGANVTLAGCTVVGGNGDAYTFPFTFVDPGLGGDAVLANEGGVIDVRGNLENTIQGGQGDHPQLGPVPFNGYALRGINGGSVQFSGVTPVGEIGPGTEVLAPPAPFQFARGEAEPGDVRRLSLFGASGAPAVMLASFSSSLVPLPELSGIELWIDPAQLAEAQAFVLQGQNVPVNWVWETPSDPSFAGFAYQIQSAVFFEGGFVGTNPTALILGF